MRLKTDSAWADFGVAAAIFLAATLTGSLVLVWLQTASWGFPAVVTALLAGYVIQFGAAIFFAGVYYRRKTENRPLFIAPFKWFSAPLTLLGILLITAASVVLEPLLNIFPEHYLKDLGEMLGSGLWPIVLTVVLAPVLEEVFFRGLVLEQLRRRVPAWQAVLASAVFFGLVHMPNLPQMVNAMVMATILGYLYVVSGSLMAVIVVHAVNNGIAYLTLEMTGTQSTDLREIVGNDTVYWAIFGVSAAILAVSLVFLARGGRKSNKKVKETLGQDEGNS